MSKSARKLRVHISNISEDVWEFIQTMSDESLRQFEIDENAELSDRDLFAFAGEDDMALILPRPLDDEFREYFLNLFPKKAFFVFVPAAHTGQISLDAIRDTHLLSSLEQLAKKYTTVACTSYSASAQFFTFVKTLQSRGIHVQTPEAPHAGQEWTVNFFGSKTGIRQLATTGDRKVFPTVRGFSTFGIELAASMAASMYEREGAVVVKTNKGHAGAGVLIFRPGELQSGSVYTQIYSRLAEETYWKRFPILIEEYVDCDKNIGGGFPNAEYSIDPNGKCTLLYYCGMRVSKAGMFQGVEVGQEALPIQSLSQLTKHGAVIAKKLARFGYAGFFDVDCLAAPDGTIYVSESNVRRTGGTHVYFVARALFGPTFLETTTILSNNSYTIPSSTKHTFSTLRETLEPILFDSTRREGLLITAANPLYRGVFGYIILASSRSRAQSIEKKMVALLTSS